MAELTTEQIVKVVIGALILVVVIGGVYLIFSGKIFSYFDGLAPKQEPPNLETPYYQELLKEANLAAVLVYNEKDKVKYIKIGERMTSYYVDKKRFRGEGIYYHDGKRFFDDSKVGIFDKNNIVQIDPDSLLDDRQTLDNVHQAERIGDELRKMKQ